MIESPEGIRNDKKPLMCAKFIPFYSFPQAFPKEKVPKQHVKMQLNAMVTENLITMQLNATSTITQIKNTRQPDGTIDAMNYDSKWRI